MGIWSRKEVGKINAPLITVTVFGHSKGPSEVSVKVGEKCRLTKITLLSGGDLVAQRGGKNKCATTVTTGRERERERETHTQHSTNLEERERVERDKVRERRGGRASERERKKERGRESKREGEKESKRRGEMEREKGVDKGERESSGW